MRMTADRIFCMLSAAVLLLFHYAFSSSLSNFQYALVTAILLAVSYVIRELVLIRWAAVLPRSIWLGEVRRHFFLKERRYCLIGLIQAAIYGAAILLVAKLQGVPHETPSGIIAVWVSFVLITVVQNYRWGKIRVRRARVTEQRTYVGTVPESYYEEEIYIYRRRRF